MKAAELAQHLTCTLCHRPVTHTGLPLFWRVTVERFGIDAQAVRRQKGLGDALGSHALAAVMGPDPDMAKPVMDPAKVTLCERCAVDDALAVAAIAEAARIERPDSSNQPEGA